MKGLKQMAKALQAKDDAPAPIGHNTSEEAIIRAYCADMVVLRAEQADLRERIKARRTLLKAQAPGTLVTELDRVIKMQTWGHDEIRDSFDRTERYARFLGLPIGAQANLFDGLPDFEAVREKWGERGYRDGLAGRGKPEEPPKECPQDARQRYGERWQEGQAETVAAYAAVNGVSENAA